MTLIVGFDIETGSAKHLHLWKEPESYLVLSGAIVNGEVVTSTDFSSLIKFLYRADIIYGHNILGFDIPALVEHAGADWDLLAPKAVDTLVLARHRDPPQPKTFPPTLYSLNAVAQRLGVEGKTDDIKSLADQALESLIIKETAGLEEAEAKVVRKDILLRYKDIGGYHLIHPWDPDLREYLIGDLKSSEAVYHRLRHMNDIPYVKREMENWKDLQYMSHAGWRADLNLLKRRVAEEEKRFQEASQELAEKAPGLPIENKAPLATKAGKSAFTLALIKAGVREEDIPRTPRTATVSTSRDALSAEDWVTVVYKTVPRFNRETRSRTLVQRPVRERRPGLRKLYPENSEVHRLCELATIVSGKARKYAELLEHADEKGRIFPSIGSVQVSGRFAMVEPSVTNIGKRGSASLAQREVFLPRRPEEALLCVDLDQGDMRVVAAHCQDPEYLKLFLPGVDAHMETAFLVFGERTPDARSKAKALGHATNYGGGEDTVVATSGQPREVVRQFFRAREENYPGLFEWQDKTREEAKTGEIADNGWGRRMICDKSMAYTQGPALYGQTGTREILMDGVRRMPRYVRKMLVAIVHDEVVLSVPRDQFDKVAKIVKESLECIWRGVPFTAGVSCPGSNWAECYAKG